MITDGSRSLGSSVSGRWSTAIRPSGSTWTASTVARSFGGLLGRATPAHRYRSREPARRCAVIFTTTACWKESTVARPDDRAVGREGQVLQLRHSGARVMVLGEWPSPE